MGTVSKLKTEIPREAARRSSACCRLLAGPGGSLFFGDITLARLLAVVSLAALAFFLRPKAVLLCTATFALLCFLLLTFWRHSLVLPGFGDLPEMETPVSFGRGFVRSLTVLIAGGFVPFLVCKENNYKTRPMRWLR